LHSPPTKRAFEVTNRGKEKAPAWKLNMDGDAIMARLLDAVEVEGTFVTDKAKEKLQEQAELLADEKEVVQL
jgi:hypothetical protein